jgi:hypothetical protein
MPREDSAGYATPAAAAISMAIALVAAATVSRSFAELRLARAEFQRAQVEAKLSAAQDAAMLTISTSTRPPPYRWTFSTLGQSINVVAEPEVDKVGLAGVSTLDDETLAGFGLTDPTAVRNALAQALLGRTVYWVADAASAPAWRACGAAYVSPYGRALALHAPIYTAPHSGETPSFWRAGEVWRVQVTNPDGWRDERIVRFTGDGLSPGQVIDRRLSRVKTGEWKCETLLGGSAAA